MTKAAFFFLPLQKQFVQAFSKMVWSPHSATQYGDMVGSDFSFGGFALTILPTKLWHLYKLHLGGGGGLPPPPPLQKEP